MPKATDAPLSVSELTREIKDAVEGRFRSATVCGEICDFRGIHGSGHIYCGLKDAGAKIRMVVWRSTKLAFKLEEGMRVTVRGAVEVYAPQGSYQLIARAIEPEGVGALQMAFRQLCERLQKEGLFDQEHKQALPANPKRIGIVTAPTSAAIRDMLRIVRRRDPRLEVVIYPARVQGDGAAAEIAGGIRFLNRHRTRLGLDALIVGRGGGSFEDLWAFNEELVARAIFASKLPIVSAVGHEIDTTVADLVADVRAATPSEAAELLVPEFSAYFDVVADAQSRLERALRDTMRQRVEQVAWLREKTELLSPTRRVREDGQRLDFAAERLRNILSRRLQQWQTRLERGEARLQSLSPLAVLKRGYGLVRTPEGRVIESIQSLKAGDALRISLADGIVDAQVEGVQSARKAP